ncbi:MAG: Ni/Fe hydrogenase subunit alpha, partial [Bacteroidota bacterium]
ICMSIKKAAQKLIGRDTEITEGTLNMIEMAFRAYDPCFSCATHSLPGTMRMELEIKDQNGQTIRTIRRD